MSGRTVTRGHIDKRQAILDAAFTVFARRGYAQACVQEIAQEAGVAKPTLYNHLGDKENLFREAVMAAGEAVAVHNLSIVGRLQDAGSIESVLRRVAFDLAQSCCDGRARSLRRLMYAEVTQFPELLEQVHGRTSRSLSEALAGQFARLSLSGRLRSCDPSSAAEQFLALITGPMETRSQLGTRAVRSTETNSVVGAAVDTFLRAYGAKTAAVALAR